jgi:hypothetical protein
LLDRPVNRIDDLSSVGNIADVAQLNRWSFFHDEVRPCGGWGGIEQ